MHPSRFYSKSSEKQSKCNYEEKHSTSAVPPAKPLPISRIIKLRDVWKTFPRQQMAFDYMRRCAQSVALFAYESEEIGGGGKRRYLVATYLTFVNHYLRMKPPRHYYEVIPEGVACKLYFDMEYKRSVNLSLCGADLVNIFVKHSVVCCNGEYQSYVLYELEECFGLSCSTKSVLDLDSSTDQKFSRHLIFVTHAACFASLHHVGNFVHHVCHKLRQLHHSSNPVHCYSLLFPSHSSPKHCNHCPTVEELLRLSVKDDRGGLCLICDEGVYTKNRNFRLPLSSKLGKNVPLLPTKGSVFKGSYLIDERNISYSTKFALVMDSLVCNVSYEYQPRLLTFGGSSPHHKLSTAHNSSTITRSPDAPTEEGYAHSPYPEVDHFITKQLTRGGAQGAIRRWTLFPQGKLLVYDIKDYHWCENIGRPHKSNNIMIIADLLEGVYYQKCYDPECRRINYRSQNYVIPNDINPVTHGNNNDEWEDNITAIGADELNASLEAAENFEDFIQAEDDEYQLTSHTTATVDDTMDEHTGAVSLTSQSYHCTKEDKFLESINWDEVLK